ncbi:SHOCT domain-containing protein [Halorubellus salinus]|uniref:SHOCT domain-containing protein n=1 Tax=Halorubellus salinus TaxID=755309 RepID=UPI001D07C768|nr:SHOCT domain-containing protein [Halorubellus salinus]
MFNDNRPHHGQHPLERGTLAVTSLVAAGVTALTLTVAFNLLALDVSLFWVAFPIGFGVVLPAAIGIVNARQHGEQRTDDTSQRSDTHTGLEILRQRYATGELSEEEFEHHVERLLESEREEDPYDDARTENRR